MKRGTNRGSFLGVEKQVANLLKSSKCDKVKYCVSWPMSYANDNFEDQQSYDLVEDPKEIINIDEQKYIFPFLIPIFATIGKVAVVAGSVAARVAPVAARVGVTAVRVGSTVARTGSTVARVSTNSAQVGEAAARTAGTAGRVAATSARTGGSIARTGNIAIPAAGSIARSGGSVSKTSGTISRTGGSVGRPTQTGVKGSNHASNTKAIRRCRRRTFGGCRVEIQKPTEIKQS